ncbi:MAG: alpha/beta hydrolase, partial [Gammaproteobacteria bacterium]|nr:alpha/beta hydrolase [Gammaproteobacteria bacterium]
LGTEFIEYSQAQCAVWPRGTRPDDFRQPLSTDTPVLLLSGELDPVTPARYGEQVLEGLDHGVHLVLRGQGHNVIGAGCMPRLMAQFIESADAKSLETECLDRLSPTPPFSGYHGWEP